jgi:hypothetical protein
MPKSRKRKTHKTCCAPVWMEADGSMHAILPGEAPDETQLEHLSRSYQESIRNSPLWTDMVKEFGEAKAEKLLAQCRAEVHP